MSYIQMKDGAILAGRICKSSSPPTSCDTSIGNVTFDSTMAGVQLPARKIVAVLEHVKWVCLFLILF
jgi:hypothetical protein